MRAKLALRFWSTQEGWLKINLSLHEDITIVKNLQKNSTLWHFKRRVHADAEVLLSCQYVKIRYNSYMLWIS